MASLADAGSKSLNKGSLEVTEAIKESEIIVFTGPGKGKTTAALGVALRTIGQGGKVIFVHFTGPGHPVLGEVKAAAAIGGSLRMIGIRSEASDVSYLDGFSESVDTVAEALTMARELWVRECDLLVLDDITHHLERGSIDVAQVLHLIDSKTPNASILLTGSFVPQLIVQRADLVTEFLQIKHPTDAGVHLRRGIDF